MSLFASRQAWQLPVQWPDGAMASDAPLVARDQLLKAAILFAMLTMTVLDRFGLLGLAGTGMLAMYALVGAMVLKGVAELNLRAAFAYLAIVGVATLSLLVNAAFAPLQFFSITSLLLLIALYAPFCVSLRQESVAPELWRWTVNLYIAFAVFVGVAGIMQFFVQFVFDPPWLFNYTPLIPEPLRTPAATVFNTVHNMDEASRGGAWTKSNGFFMREPSYFSVVMAFGLVCELSLARRKWVMSVLILGLMLSYSGSGLLCLAVALLFPLGRATAVRVLAFVAVAATLFVLFADALHLSYTLNRVEEFNSPRSSAYCRIIQPAVEVVQRIDSNPWSALLGHGPGSWVRMVTGCADSIQTTYAKILFEYGVLGALAFGVWMFGALSRSSAPVRIRVAWAVAWLPISGAMLDPMYLLFIYIVSAMWPPDTARKLNSGAPGRDAQRFSFQAPKSNIGGSGHSR
jgi:hypothetical protein